MSPLHQRKVSAPPGQAPDSPGDEAGVCLPSSAVSWSPAFEGAGVCKHNDLPRVTTSRHQGWGPVSAPVG